jgi:hypothetical protein
MFCISVDLKLCFHPQKIFECLLAWCIFFTTILFLSYRLTYYFSLRDTLSMTSETSLLSQWINRTVKITDLQLSKEDAVRYVDANKLPSKFYVYIRQSLINWSKSFKELIFFNRLKRHFYSLSWGH